MRFRLDPMGKGGKTESLGTILDLCSHSDRISYDLFGRRTTMGILYGTR